MRARILAIQRHLRWDFLQRGRGREGERSYNKYFWLEVVLREVECREAMARKKRFCFVFFNKREKGDVDFLFGNKSGFFLSRPKFFEFFLYSFSILLPSKMEDDPCPVAIACRQVAKKVFGIDHLRFGQLEAAVAAVEKKDSIVVLPTGAGKSRCFQLVPSILKELQRPKGLVMVIQPLLMLLKTQTEDLRSLGLEAGVDAQSDIRDQQVLIKARRGDLDFCKWTSSLHALLCAPLPCFSFWFPCLRFHLD